MYHGSPHKMAPTESNPLGEFDPTKIGTGQGAQSYGYGHYLAENPKVAGGAEYRDPQGMFNRLTGVMNNREEFAHDMISQGREPAKVWEMMKQKYGQFFDEPTLKADFEKVSSARGNLYKVDLPDEQIAKMLDWDKPLSQQHPDVQAAIQKLGDKYRPLDATEAANVTGERLYRRIENSLGKHMGNSADPDASKFLREAGIPGIRYLDQGSRGSQMRRVVDPDSGTSIFHQMKGGETADKALIRLRGKYPKAVIKEVGEDFGTSNFVVFPGGEKMLNILERQ